MLFFASMHQRSVCAKIVGMPKAMVDHHFSGCSRQSHVWHYKLVHRETFMALAFWVSLVFSLHFHLLAVGRHVFFRVNKFHRGNFWSLPYIISQRSINCWAMKSNINGHLKLATRQFLNGHLCHFLMANHHLPRWRSRILDPMGQDMKLSQMFINPSDIQ